MVSARSLLLLIAPLVASSAAFVPSSLPRTLSIDRTPVSSAVFITAPSRYSFTANVGRVPICLAAATENSLAETELVGDDAAYFSLKEQSLGDWTKFSVATGTVLAAVAWAWILPSGPHGGDLFLESIQSVMGTTDPAVTVFAMLSFFAVSHSGLAGLRTYAEPVVGARAWRVLFAVVSLPLALSCISYFVNHAHEGTQFWDVSGNEAVHAAVWIANFVSFLFLYPSTFNLLEIAAIEEPQLHLWETGVTRITRHPQAAGQVLWCAAHSLWLGTSTALAASASKLPLMTIQ